MRKILSQNFFNRPTLLVAEELLGKYLVRRVGKREIASMILETEAYDGPKDKACHARSGRTGRNFPMFERASTIYVYFTYGMHWMLNLVTGVKEYPAAVLIRGVESVNGPGRLTKYFSIDKELNAQKLGKRSGLWVEDRGVVISKKDIKRTGRIGVAYAGIWAKKPYRFVVGSKTGRSVKKKKRG